MGGRFGAGLPPISYGSLLFLQHMISKMKRDGEGSKIGIVFNGSPLFSGGDHFRFVELGEFVVIPNHVHGIIIIDNPVETGHALSLQKSI